MRLILSCAMHVSQIYANTIGAYNFPVLICFEVVLVLRTKVHPVGHQRKRKCILLRISCQVNRTSAT